MRTSLKNKMTIKNRLILIEIISILGMIVIGLVAIMTSRKINQASTDIADFQDFFADCLILLPQPLSLMDQGVFLASSNIETDILVKFLPNLLTF